MTRLIDIQTQLQDYLLGKDSAIESAIAMPPQGDRAERLEIYGHTYYKRLIRVLQQNFQAVSILMGAQKFAEIAYEYIKAKPSRYFSVDDMGKHFPEFLSKHKDYQAEPIYAELAQFEHAMSQSYDAKDVELLSNEDIGVIPQHNWPMMHLSLAPCVSLLQFHCNTVDYYDAVVQQQQPPAPCKLVRPQDCVVWRYEYTPYYYKTDQDEAKALQLIADDKSFLDICQALCEHRQEEEVTPLVVDYMLQWLSKGMLSRVEVRK